MQTMPRSLYFALCLGFGALAMLGCEETGPRVYTARLYHSNATGGCLDSYTPIGLVEANELGSSCESVCLLEDASVYVSTVCAPYPSTGAVVSPDDSPDCAAALALLDGDAAAACE